MTFTYFEDSEGNYRLLNLAQVCRVEQISEGRCVLVFADGFALGIEGKGADMLITRLLSEAELLDGTLLAQAAEAFRRGRPSGPKVEPIKPEESE